MASNVAQAVKSSIFVSNLPWTIGRRELQKYFSQFGKITNVNIVFDKETGMSKRFGFVSFKDDETTQSVFNAKDHQLEGKILNIQIKQNEV